MATLAEVAPAPAPTVLDDRAKVQLFTDPFDYAVVDDALPAPIYQALARTYPDGNLMPANRVANNNQRYNLIANWGSAEFPLEQASPEWRRFIDAHSSASFVEQVFDLFPRFTTGSGEGRRVVVDRLGPELADTLKVDAEVPLAEINARATVAINAPVRTENRVRGVHTDAKRKAYVGLYYFRGEDDDSVGGDLEIHRWKAGVERRPWVVKAGDDETELAATIPYKANRFVLFPTTHEALHAVSPRGVTPHIRKLVVTSGWLPDVDFYDTDTMHGRFAGWRASALTRIRRALKLTAK